MIPLSVTLKNIGPFADTTIDLEELGPIIGINAPKGTGKTFFLEAAFAALYGDFPSRGVNLRDCIRLGERTASIVLVFEHDGERYIAERTFGVSASGKSFNHTATIRRQIETGAGFDEALRPPERIVAGPKISAVAVWVEARLGSAKVALSTWFACQGGAGDLCRIPPAERRDAFGEMLDFPELNKDSDRCRDAAKKAKTQIETLVARTDGVEVHEIARDNNAEEMRETEAELAEAERSRDVAEFHRDEAEGEIGRLEAEISDSVLAAKEAERLGASLKDLDEQISREAVRREDADAVEPEVLGRVKAESLEALELEAANDVNLELDKKDALRARAAYRAAEESRIALESKKCLLAAKRVTQDRSRENLISAEDLARINAKADKLDTLEAEFDEAELVRKAIGPPEARRLIAEAEIAGIAEDLDAENDDLKTLDVPGPPEDCERCPLLGDKIARRDRLQTRAESHLVTLKAATAELAALPQGLRKPSDIMEEIFEAKDACVRFRDAHVIATDFNDWTIEIYRLASEIDATEIEAILDPTEEIERIDEAIRTARECATLAREIRKAHAASIGSAETLNALDARRSAVLAESRKLVPTKGLLDAAEIEAKRRKIEALGKEFATEKQRALASRMRISELAKREAVLIERAKVMAERIEEAKKAAEEIAALRIRAAALRKLQTCFGPKGVQAILVDQALPDISARADAFLQTLYGGTLRIGLSTQSANLDGEIREDFSIFARDAAGGRDVSAFSGGEKRELALVLRVAVIGWISALRGIKPESLFIDEAVDALDPESGAKMLDLLAELSQRFGRVILITHDSTMAEMLPVVLRMRKTLSGVEVVREGVASCRS